MGLSYDFGHLKLSASWVMSLRFVNIVYLTGVLRTESLLAEVEFEMPLQVESLGQCAAWVTWHLDQAAHIGVFQPERETAWLLKGRKYIEKLPWVAEAAAFNARPKCLVERDWLRMALKTLAGNLATMNDEALVHFGFDGSVLKIECDNKVVALSAEGTAWQNRFSIPAGKLRILPRRIMRELAEIYVWEDQLYIARYCFSGASIFN